MGASFVAGGAEISDVPTKQTPMAVTASPNNRKNRAQGQSWANTKSRLKRVLGPGLITGASDDDPWHCNLCMAVPLIVMLASRPVSGCRRALRLVARR